MKHNTITPLKEPITATISIPGSKSYTNRALIISAISNNNVIIHNPLFSDDTKAMIDCLQMLGIPIMTTKHTIEIHGGVEHIHEKQYDLHARLSGTTIRFILALSTVVPGTKILYGHDGLNKRPISELVEGLQQLGAIIDYEKNSGFPPLIIRSNKLRPGVTKLSGGISSQYFSALMMIAPLVGEMTIEVVGNQISKSYIDMTIDTMKTFGVTVQNENYQRYIIATGQQYNRKEYTVEGDFSGAGYFFAIAALTKSTLTLKNLNPDSKQGDLQFVKILEQMGNKTIAGDNQITIIGSGVKPIEVDMEQCPDQAQTLAVLSAFAPGKTIMTGIRSLRVKETERAEAIQNELTKMGIKTESTNDSITIYGGDPKPAAIDTYGDHRMAMSFAVAGAKLDGMTINEPDVVIKTFPAFWEKLEEVGIRTQHYDE